MAWALRVAAVLTGTLALHVAALTPPPPYNLRATYFLDASCNASMAFLVQEYYFPNVSQCVMTPSYPPPEARFPTTGMAWSVVSCNSTAAVVSVCNKTCGNCTTQTMPQQVCIPMDGGRSQMVNFTCSMDPSLPPASTGRPVHPCYAAQVNGTAMCKATDDVDICDPMSPCNQSLSALWAACPGSVPLLTSTDYANVSAFQTAIQMQCTPCTAAYNRNFLHPYCDLDNSSVCYADCVHDVNATLQLCNNTVPTRFSDNESQFVPIRNLLGEILNKCGNATMPPPPPNTTAAITFTYYKDGNASTCSDADAWPNTTTVNFTYSIGQDLCVPGPWAPGYPAGSYYFRFDACNGQRVLVADCDANCTCGSPYEIKRGQCWAMLGYKQVTSWDRCPIPMPPTTTTTTTMTATTTTMPTTTTTMPATTTTMTATTTMMPATTTTMPATTTTMTATTTMMPATTMTMPPANTTTMPPPDTTTMLPANTTMMPLPPPVVVSGSMTVKAATQDAANALVVDPQVRTAFATGIATIAGVDPSLVNVSLSVGTRRLGASVAAPLRRLDVSILVSYIITLPADGGAAVGGASLPTPDAVKTALTNTTPDQVQAAVTAAYVVMNAAPPAFTVDTVATPTVMYPTTTTTMGRMIGTAGGAEWGARPWLWLAGLLALASARFAA